MADWTEPTGFQLEALHGALLFAYPTPEDFDQLLQFKLGRSYDAIAPVRGTYENSLVAILVRAKGDGWLDDLVLKAKQDKPRSPRLRVLDESLGLTNVDVPATLRFTLEDIVRNEAGFADLFPWIEKLSGLGRRVCRVENPVNTAWGTGCLVGPDLVLTNWHVIQRALSPGGWNPAEFVCRFDYFVTAAGARGGVEEKLAAEWCVDFSPASTKEVGTGADAPSPATLDFALLRLSRRAAEDEISPGLKRGWVDVKTPGPVRPKDIVFLLQHPDGLPVKLAAGDVADISADKLRFGHTANSQGGSSGSMVLNAKLEPIGLHHAGDSKYSEGTIGHPQQNQGIPLGLIAARLAPALP